MTDYIGLAIVMCYLVTSAIVLPLFARYNQELKVYDFIICVGLAPLIAISLMFEYTIKKVGLLFSKTIWTSKEKCRDIHQSASR